MGTPSDADPDATLHERAALLLAGPRGRRLCLEVLELDDPNLGIFLLEPPGGSHDGRVRAQLAEDLQRVTGSADLDGWAATADPWRAMEPLSASIAAAMYWQPPDVTDLWLAEPELAVLLWPVALALAGSPGNTWWFEPMDAGTQGLVQWVDEAETTPGFDGAGAKLAAWDQHNRADEAAAAERSASTRKRDQWGLFSGVWWSAPSLHGLIVTTRRLPGPGDASGPGPCVRLALIEDGLGWDRAKLQPVAPAPGARVYEIAEPAHWVDLAVRYPREVTASRRSDWYHVTGRDERWLMPDWQGVGRDFDAVHLQLAAYLGGAGRPLDVAGPKTVIAGYDPDATYWLGDAVQPAGEPEPWRLAGHGDDSWRWEPGE